MLSISSRAQDENSSLIGAHSYCTQEMVNLALTGRARSNVFNGVQDLGGLVLRGIDSRAEIGFLSLFEHYENIAVGSHLKSPRLPIWVVCSESHYTLLLGLDAALSTTVPPLGRFDLFYYDELARQREEIRLSIDVSKATPPQKDGDLEPPINGQRPPRPAPDAGLLCAVALCLHDQGSLTALLSTRCVSLAVVVVC